MPTEAIAYSAKGIDLSSRYLLTTTVVASPAAAAETIIAQSAPIRGDVAFVTGVDLTGWAAYTVGTSGSAVRFRLRQTNVVGAVVGDSGALTGSQHGAGILSSDDIEGFDAAPAVGQVYVLTMQVTAGAAPSTVSAVKLRVIAV